MILRPCKRKAKWVQTKENGSSHSSETPNVTNLTGREEEV